jgi:hypothetical protein
MNSSVTISEKTWNSIISTNPDSKKLLELFKFSVKIHTDYLQDGYNLYGYPTRTYTLEFQNKKSYTHFILKYGDLIRTSLD